MRLIDLAHLLGYSAAYLSAIETGRKPIPANFVGLVARAFALEDNRIEILRDAEDRTKTEVNLDEFAPDRRHLVAAFARKIDEVPPEIMAALRNVLVKKMPSEEGETPFRRRRRGFLVPPASTKGLREFAEKVRRALIPDEQVMLPIIEVLELTMPTIFEGFYLEVCDREEMEANEGEMIAGRNGIRLRVDVYERACRGVGRDRFTACHEFGHFLLHREITMARISEDRHPIYQDSEWQADTFAGALLMSSRHVREFNDEYDAAGQCGMTPQAASVMLGKYKDDL